MKRRKIVISHSRDVDGIACHVLFRMHFLEHGIVPEHIYIDYGTVRESFSKLKGVKNADIYIADFNLDERHVPYCLSVLKGTKDRGCKIYWYDHHEWDPTPFREICNEFILAKDGLHECAADLVLEKFGVENGGWITSLAHDHDLGLIKIPESRMLEKIIYPNREDEGFLNALVEKISETTTWNKWLQKAYEKFAPLFYKEFKATLNARRVEEAEGFKVFFVHDEEDLFVDATELFYELRDIENSELDDDEKELLKKQIEDVEIFVMVYGTRKLSFRRKHRDSGPRLDFIASALDGGGHDFAASAYIKMKNYNEGAQETLKAIKKVGRKKLLIPSR